MRLLIDAVCFCWSHQPTLFQFIFKQSCSTAEFMAEKLHYPWFCKSFHRFKNLNKQFALELFTAHPLPWSTMNESISLHSQSTRIFVCIFCNKCKYAHILKGSYYAFLKIIILCFWCNRICWNALMFKKHIIFQTLYIIVGPLCPASFKCFVFCKVPPSDKHGLLWLANWHSAL